MGVPEFGALPLAPLAPPEGVPADKFRFDAARADRAVRFIETCCPHTKGRYAGKPFILEPWQRDIVRAIFGTVEWDEQYDEAIRQYRLAWIELARKNGKSEFLSAFALLGLCADDEESAEVYSVAADKDQAGLVYATAKRMVELGPLRDHVEIIDSRKRLIYRKTNSFYQVLPGDAGGALGTNPSMVLFDEVLTQKDRHLWDAMRQGFGTRRQPIMIAATTAAYTSAAFALEEHEYGERVLADPLIDPARYVFMRNVPRDWDWENPGTPAVYDADGNCVSPATGWYWANPALGSFLSIGTMNAEYMEAKEKPTAQNSFRVFRLNQWVSQANRWLDMAVYDSSGVMKFTEDELSGQFCYGGLDLASTSDFTAWVLVFPGDPTGTEEKGVTVLPHFFVPRSAIEKRAPMRTSFEVWEREGFITVTEGQVTDYNVIEERIRKDAARFHIAAIGYDQWNATQIVGNLSEAGLDAVKVPQSAARLNDPCKQVEALVADRKFYHAGNPVLRWMFDNVELDITGDGLMKPSKAKSGEKIDGVAATLNALFVSSLGFEEKPDVGFMPFEDDPADTAPDGRPRDEMDEVISLLSGSDSKRSFWDDDDDD